MINKLKSKLKRLFNFIGVDDSRTINISRHVLLSFFYKGGSILSSFLLVPLTINFLDTENYGIWLTLSSFIAWFSFFDIGLGHGLRNKFSEAKASNNGLLAKGYVSTAYFTISIISVLSFVVFLIVNYFVDWTLFFNTNKILYKDLRLLMPIVFGFFCLQLIVKLITSIYLADQKHSIQGKIGFISSFSSLVIVWVLTQMTHSSLLVYGTIFSALPVLILIVLNLTSFSNTYKQYIPLWSNFKKIYFKDIFGLGLSFFIIQISGIVLFSTDNFIITKLYNPEEVVPYNIAFKYMSISQMVFSIILTPYWSSVTDAYTKKDFDWVKKSMKNLSKLSIAFIFIILFMLAVSKYVYEIWIGHLLIVPFELTLSMAFYFIVTVLFAPYNIFLNGIGKMKLQSIIAIVILIINIPLSIFLAKILGLGVIGVISSSILCISLYLIFSPIQYYKIMNNKAKGIWNK
ncbi:lipopolysaccharide biosynthesis protein [Winogradskyella sp. PE311]|uniref:lipopolysaccharide biosynthesis protein n=1 Tax=Winogradskyella sp. PE311 TaxID=3366943 RepID=UPI0039810208